MNDSSLVQLVVAIAAIAAVVVSIIAFLQTRRKDEAEIKVEQRVGQFDELERMNGILRLGLNDAQLQTKHLHDDLVAAQADVERLNTSLTVALANVTLLDDFIEQHVPQGVPRPRLRRMPQ